MKKLSYPMNLINDIVDYTDQINDEETKTMFAKSIDIIFNSHFINERTTGIIKMRYENNLTFREIGEKFDITSNRSRDVVNYGLRRIRGRYGRLLTTIPKIKTYPTETQKALTNYIFVHNNQRNLLINIIANDDISKAIDMILKNQLIRTILISERVPLDAIFNDLSESYLPSCSVSLDTPALWLDLGDSLNTYIKKYKTYILLCDLIDAINGVPNARIKGITRQQEKRIRKIVNDAGYGHLIQCDE